MALGYFSFRHGLPLSIRSALYPIFGRRVHGRLGDGIDLAAVIGTIFGIATSLGISIALLNAGLSMVFGVEQGYVEYTMRISEPGTYRYACLLHPPMVGTVVVR